MNASEFKKLATQYFAPKIKELGWKGNGFNYHQPTNNHIINIFGIQGSWTGGSVCCETAIHFDFLPDTAGKTDPSKISYASCLIRKRLTPKGDGDYHWFFKDNMEQNIKSISEIWSTFEKHGIEFYEDFLNFPYPFDEIKPSDLFGSRNFILLNKYNVYNYYFFAVLLIKVNLLIGSNKLAEEFSKTAVENANNYYGQLIKETKSKKAQLETKQFLDNLITKLIV